MEYSFSYREKNGSVCLILSYKVGKRWKQKTKQGFKTQREARKYQDTLLAQVKETAGLTDDIRLKDISLRDFFPIFERDKKNILAYNTILNYGNAVSRLGPIADIPIRELTPADIANALLRLQVKASTKGGFLCNISSVLEHARKMYKIINTNPARGIQLPKDKTPVVLRAFSREELSRLLKLLEPWPLGRLVVLIGAGTGMRFGEIAGLPWDAINWQKQTITVRQQLSRTASGKIGIKQCKTIRSNRTIPASIEVLAALRKWKRTTPENISGTVCAKRDGRGSTEKKASGETGVSWDVSGWCESFPFADEAGWQRAYSGICSGSRRMAQKHMYSDILTRIFIFLRIFLKIPGRQCLEENPLWSRETQTAISPGPTAKIIEISQWKTMFPARWWCAAH